MANLTSLEENQLTGIVIRHLFVLDRSKQVINRARIKNVLGNDGKQFNQIMGRVKSVLSKVFGYKLLELESMKYILINEVKNDLLHTELSTQDNAQQVLLFLVLAHIFMLEESCPEGKLWHFLHTLGIVSEDNYQHNYFGNVKKLITEEFVAKKYLNKVAVDANDPLVIEYKWGPRADQEVSRRSILQFVSQMYNGRPIKSWPMQLAALTAREKAKRQSSV